MIQFAPINVAQDTSKRDGVWQIALPDNVSRRDHRFRPEKTAIADVLEGTWQSEMKDLPEPVLSQVTGETDIRTSDFG